MLIVVAGRIPLGIVVGFIFAIFAGVAALVILCWALLVRNGYESRSGLPEESPVQAMSALHSGSNGRRPGPPCGDGPGLGLGITL